MSLSTFPAMLLMASPACFAAEFAKLAAELAAESEMACSENRWVIVSPMGRRGGGDEWVWVHSKSSRGVLARPSYCGREDVHRQGCNSV